MASLLEKTRTGAAWTLFVSLFLGVPGYFYANWDKFGTNKTPFEWFVERGWRWRLVLFAFIWFLSCVLISLFLYWVMGAIARAFGRRQKPSRLEGEIQDFVIMPLTQRDHSPRVNIWLRVYLFNSGEVPSGIKNFGFFCKIGDKQYEASFAEEGKLTQTHEEGYLADFKGREFYNLVDFIHDHRVLTAGEPITGHLHFILPNPKTRDLKALGDFWISVTDTWGQEHKICRKRVPLHPSERIIMPANPHGLEFRSYEPKLTFEIDEKNTAVRFSGGGKTFRRIEASVRLRCFKKDSDAVGVKTVHASMHKKHNGQFTTLAAKEDSFIPFNPHILNMDRWIVTDPITNYWFGFLFELESDEVEKLSDNYVFRVTLFVVGQQPLIADFCVNDWEIVRRGQSSFVSVLA